MPSMFEQVMTQEGREKGYAEGLAAAEVLRPIRDAPDNTDIIIIDNHGFAYRAKRTERAGVAGWVLHGRREPTFDDSDLQGWLPMPTGISA